tara:strand:- start:1122 stop:2954 length:1833 start_codon:yes stop_codon:yes gene_type:complete
MSKKLENFKIFLGVVLSVLVATLLWDKIVITYNNPGNVVGVYSELKLSPYNNLFRFLFFTLFPITVFTILFNYYHDNKLINLKDIFVTNSLPLIDKNKTIFYLLLLSIFFVIINFFSSEFSLQKIDIFHEGLALSHGLNSKITGNLWSDSFLQNSLFSEFINPQLAWLISKSENIGSIRANHIFLRLLTELTLILFIYHLIKILNFKKNYMALSFLILGILSIYLNQKLTENFYPVRYRDIPLFIFLITSLKLITNSDRKIFYSFFVGNIAVISIFWSLDKGIYINASLFFLLMFFLIQKEYIKFYAVTISTILGWLFFYLFLGNIEFSNFLYNSFHVIKNQDLLNGLVHPTPFFFEENEHSARGTKNFIIIILNGIMLSYIIFSRKINLSNSTKAFLFFFFILAFINYKGGISRADGYHMKQSIFPNLVLFISLLLVFIQKYLSKDILLNKNFHFTKLVFFISLVLNISLLNTNNLKQIFSFNKNYKEYVSLEDNYFLNDDYKNLIKKLESYDLDCIQLFSYDSGLPYFLRKKSCTRYNFIYILSSNKVQNDFISELDIKKPKIILANESYPSNIIVSPHLRFRLVSNYIEKNYKIREKFKEWIIYEIK